MAKQILTDLNLNGNQIINSSSEKLATAPVSPTIDQHYFNTTDNKEYYWNGTAWIEIGGGGGEPAEYLKSVAVNGDTLTITNKHDVETNFTPITSTEVQVDEDD